MARPVSCTGETKRSISSIPGRATAGSSRSRTSWSGLFEQGEGAAGDEVDRRLVTGHEEEDAGRQQLAFGEHAALVLRSHQSAQQVVPRPGPPLGQQLEEVLGELEDGRSSGLDDLVGEEEVGIEPPGEGVRPLLEALLVVQGHAQEVADDPDRQGIGEGVDEIDLAGLEGGVEQLVDDLLGALAQRLDHPRRERLGHEPPQARVVRRVAEEEGAHLEHGLFHHLGAAGGASEPGRHAIDVDVEAVRARPLVTEDGQAVGMSGHHPEAQLVAVDRGALPQVGVQGEGIAGPQRVEGVEDGPVGLTRGHRSRHRRRW